MDARIRLEGLDIIPATVEGEPDVFSSQGFVLVKTRWRRDDEVNVCILCNNKFNQIRRKHHCRVCGNILCSKCCKEKIPLPQLGIEEPERVCELCRPVTECVTKSFSKMQSFHLEAVNGLTEMLKEAKGIKNVLELGGLQMLVRMAKSEDENIKGYVVSGLHILSTYEELHLLLAQSGAIKAICSILTGMTETNKCQQTIAQGISALMVFCKSTQLKNQALQDGALNTVLSLCNMSESIALLALQTLSLIVEDPSTHFKIIEGQGNALSRILSLTASKDEQVQEVALKILANVSLGTDRHRQKIVQEDFIAGRCLVQAINNKPKNLQILVNVACLIGNLATTEESQGGLQEILEHTCELMMSYCERSNIMVHVSRALANFAKFPQNTHKMVSYIPYIIQYFLKSNNDMLRFQGMRAIFSLLSHNTKDTTQALLRDGAQELLQGLKIVPNALNVLQDTLLQTIPERAKPL